MALNETAGIQTAARSIMYEMRFRSNDDATPTNAQTVFNAFKNALRSMDDIECKEVGEVEEYGGVCPDGFVEDVEEISQSPNIGEDVVDVEEVSQSPNIGSGYALAEGRYVATTKGIKERAQLANDFRDMKLGSDPDAIEDIYNNGKYATDEDGNVITVASFSLNAVNVMKDDPTYNIYRYAFMSLSEDGGTNFDDEPEPEFADSIVNDLFEITHQDLHHEGVEAALVMNVWMMVAHYLHDAVSLCGQHFDDDALHSLDIAAAYWIGEGETEGGGTGNLLYAMAEEVGGVFGQDMGETMVNTKIIDGMNKAKNDIFLKKKCSADNPHDRYNSFMQLRVIVGDILAQMTVPLIQKLIQHMYDDENKFLTETYAVSLIPQLAGCNNSTFSYLLSEFVENKYIVGHFTDVVKTLQASYSCLLLSCDDVGGFGDIVPRCSDPPKNIPLAGYIPATPVADRAKIDLDLHQIRIFMQMGAYKAAKDYYMHGHNSRMGHFPESFRSLTNDKDSIENTYKAYADYYEDRNFVDSTILDILDGNGEFESARPEQRTVLVVKALQFLVMHFSPLNNLYKSVENCRGNLGRHLWDTASAQLIGSKEGTEVNGNAEGEMMYSLTKRNCVLFSTCEMPRHDLVRLIQEGSVQIHASECDHLQNTVMDIEKLLQTTLIQSTLHSAAVLSREMNPINVASGYMSLFSIIPLVSLHDESSANQLKEEMQFSTEGSDTFLNAQRVFVAFERAVPKMDGLSCADIGSLDFYGGVCQKQEVKPAVETIASGYSLAGGRYVATTDVSNQAKIAFDVRDMKKEKQKSSDIYNNGKNSFIDEKNGVLSSLANFSKSAPVLMHEDPTYNIYKYGFLPLSKDGRKFDGEPVGQFADSVVNDLFQLSQYDEAIEAALVMNLWMYIVYNLHMSIEHCRNNLDDHALHSLNVAAAYWIGEGQEKGDNEGHLLYALAEKAGAMFGQDNGETRVNTKIIDLMNTAKDDILLKGECASASAHGSFDAFVKLRIIVDDIVAQMTVPLIQNLIHYMRDTSKPFLTELYSLSVVPLLSGCSNSTFNYLLTEFTTDKYQASRFDIVYDLLQRSYSCLRLTCEDIGTYEITSRTARCIDTLLSEPLAGYIPSTLNMTEFSEIDLDILQIGIFMKMGAYSTAKDYFLYGHNSRNDYFYHTLSGIISEDNSNASLLYQAFVNYFRGDQKYSETLVLDAIDGKGKFESASPEQRAELVVKTLQAMVMYMHPITKMYDAIKSCRTTQEENAKRNWDIAAAALIGSIEGSKEGGNRSGQLIYALIKTNCKTYGTCKMDNHDLLALLYAGQWEVTAGKCEDLSKTTETIKALMDVSLIQSTLSSAITLNEEPNSAAVATGYVFASSILPLVKHADHISGLIIEDAMKFQSTVNKGQTNVQAVFDAFQKAIPSMEGFSCMDIGAVTGYGDVCPEKEIKVDEPVPNNTYVNPSESISLSGGLYVSTTNVGERSKIALDVREIKDTLFSGQKDLAKTIYEEGLNAHKFDSKGKLVGKKWSLAEFSRSAKDVMSQVPPYNIFCYALGDKNGLFLGNPVDVYADSFVQLAFDSSNVDTLAAEAMVVLNLWMYVAYKLYDVVDDCKSNAEPGSTLSGLGSNDGGVNALDEAASFWIGDLQQVGEPKGFLLYAHAEEVADAFGQDGFGQSEVNAKIMHLLNDAKSQILLENACALQSDTAIRLKHIADEVVSLMLIPLVQSLIQALIKNDHDRIRLYAISVVPHIAGCSPSMFIYLKEKLIDADDYRVSEVSEIIEKLQTTYSCLGFKCSDVGTYKEGQDVQCVDPPVMKPLAGYHPTSDVREHSKIDLDILHIKIMMEMGAYDAVKDYYMLGMHSKKTDDIYHSLQGFATSTNRDLVPQYKIYRQYFDNRDYADSIIMKALNKEFPFNDASPGQRTEVVVNSLRYMVMYMHAMQELYESIDDCESGSLSRSLDGANSWDKAASYIVGSIETSRNGGSPWYHDGQLMYGLAKQRCIQFSTCDKSSGNAQVNEELMTLLYAGQSELNNFNCEAAKSTVRAIERLLMVPLIQSTLLSALENEDLTFFSTDRSLAEGYVYSHSILPIIKSLDAEAANTIKRNMDFQFTLVPVLDGAPAVFQAFEIATRELESFDCKDVGTIQSMSICEGGSSAGHRQSISFLLCVALPIIMLKTLM